MHLHEQVLLQRGSVHLAVTVRLTQPGNRIAKLHVVYVQLVCSEQSRLHVGAVHTLVLQGMRCSEEMRSMPLSVACVDYTALS
jgi:hypothetical protein